MASIMRKRVREVEEEEVGDDTAAFYEEKKHFHYGIYERMRRRKAVKRSNCCPNSLLKIPKPIIIKPVPLLDREEETETETEIETDNTTHQPSFIVFGGNIDDFRATNSMPDGDDDDIEDDPSEEALLVGDQDNQEVEYTNNNNNNMQQLHQYCHDEEDDDTQSSVASSLTPGVILSTISLSHTEYRGLEHESDAESCCGPPAVGSYPYSLIWPGYYQYYFLVFFSFFVLFLF